MSNDVSVAEQEETTAADGSSAEFGPLETKEYEIDCLPEKMGGIQSGEWSQESEGTCHQDGETNFDPNAEEPSVLKRIFSRVSKEVEPESALLTEPKKPVAVTKMTHTQIKAMKAVTTNAAGNPLFMLKQKVLDSTNYLWLKLFRCLHDLYAEKGQ